MDTKIERRSTKGNVQIRNTDPNGGATGIVAVGYALMFGVRSSDLGGFVEEVAHGAASASIARGDDVLALVNHDPNQVLGRTGSGTLRIGEDSIGVWYEVTLPDTTAGRDLAELMRRGDINASSFGFRTDDDRWSETESGYPLRILTAVSLHDVSPVTSPAYPQTVSGLAS